MITCIFLSIYKILELPDFVNNFIAPGVPSPIVRKDTERTDFTSIRPQPTLPNQQDNREKR